MPMVVGALQAIGAIAIGTTTVGAIAANVFLSAASSFALQKLQKSRSGGAGRRLLDPDSLNSLTVDALSDRAVAVGDAAIAGEVLFTHVHADRQWCSRVIQLSDCGGALGYSLLEFRLGKELVTLGGGGIATAPANLAGRVRLRFYAGTEAQLADSTLQNISGGKWDAGRRLRGVCYAILETKDVDEKAFPSGRPEPMFKIRRNGIYDPRKDSTRGGSGSHRLDNPATWEPSRNAALVALNYALGFTMAGRVIVGGRVPPALIDWSSWVASANASDVQGWTVDGVIPSSIDPEDALNSFELHMAGRICNRRGLLACIAGHNWPTVATIGPDDLAGPFNLDPFQSWREVYNGDRGSFRSEAHNWEPVETGLVSVPAWVTEDGEALEPPSPTSFGLCNDGAQVARLVELKLYRERAPRTIRAWLVPRFRVLAEGHFVRVRIAEYGIDEVYEVDSTARDPSGACIVSLRLMDPSQIPWAGSGGANPPAFSEIDRPEPTPRNAEGWTVSPLSLQSSGASLPALDISGSVPEDIRGVLIEFRAQGQSQWRAIHDGAPAGGLYRVHGLPPGQVYEISVRYRNSRELSADRLILTATTPASLVATDAGSIGGISAQDILDALGPAIDGQSLLAETMLSQAERNFRQIENLERLAYFNGQPLATIIIEERQERIDGDEALAQTLGLIGAKSGDGLAFIFDMNKVRVSPSESLAQRFTSLAAADSNSASGLAAANAAITSEITARVNGDNALAQSLTTLSTTVNGNTASIQSLQSVTNGLQARAYLRLDVNGNIAGYEILANQTTSAFRIIASDFRIVDPGLNGGVPFTPFSVVGGVVRMAGVEVDTVKANVITANQIVAGAIVTAKIASEAVSKPRSIRSSANSSTGASASTFSTVQSLTITTTGGAVLLIGSCGLTGTFSSAATDTPRARLRILAGDILQEVTAGALEYRTVGATVERRPAGSVQMVAIDTSGAGEKTYQLQVTGSGAVVTTEDRQIVAVELLR